MFAKAVAVSLLTLASASVFAADEDKCAVTIDSTDQMSYNSKEFTVDKSCKKFTVTLTHSGNLPKNVMGHNLVVSKTADMQPIATDGLSAGIDKGYLKDGDARIIAHTKLIGAGESDKITFDTSKLEAGGDYGFFCSFPGHISMMKGKVVVK
ncbi:azurin [Pseudomonas shirazensis]|uniref:azurin n=1 Tax=Pseudomonas shirazensis TaxID=2745494 RepID=UPI003D2695D2